ncbi:MAG: hypothetical protein ACD_37C00146G0001 [uncultured bacterium]|nr:MAG: hypothetical protein ACD_37C00146G0001 [uncultured bacterium]
MIEQSLFYEPQSVPNYDIRHDQRDYIKLLSQSEERSDLELRQMMDRKDDYVRRQLITDIGERLYVHLSTTTFDLKEGKLFGRGMDEPFIDVVKRGRDERRRIGYLTGVTADFQREDAEAVGFEKIEDILKRGKMALSISPPGISYLHSFYDIFWHNEEGKIESRRYTSGLEVSEYAPKTKLIDPNSNFGFNSRDYEFLANPLVVSDFFKTPDQVHAFLHIDHSAMTKEEFMTITSDEGLSLAIDKYIEELKTNPFATEALIRRYNAILNRADYLRKLRNGESVEHNVSNLENIDSWGDKEPEQAAGGCGISGSAWSVADYGMRDTKGKLVFDCPSCGMINIRPYGTLLQVCKVCGSDKVACREAA